MNYNYVQGGFTVAYMVELVIFRQAAGFDENPRTENDSCICATCIRQRRFPS